MMDSAQRDAWVEEQEQSRRRAAVLENDESLDTIDVFDGWFHDGHDEHQLMLDLDTTHETP